MFSDIGTVALPQKTDVDDSVGLTDMPIDCLINIVEYLSLEEIGKLRVSLPYAYNDVSRPSSLRDPMVTRRLCFAPSSKKLNDIVHREQLKAYLLRVASRLVSGDHLDSFQRSLDGFLRTEETQRWFIREYVKYSGPQK